MSPLLSRILVAAILLPLVIGLVYLGGWWLFGLALVGGLLALHELYVMRVPGTVDQPPTVTAIGLS